MPGTVSGGAQRERVVGPPTDYGALDDGGGGASPQGFVGEQQQVSSPGIIANAKHAFAEVTGVAPAMRLGQKAIDAFKSRPALTPIRGKDEVEDEDEGDMDESNDQELPSIKVFIL